MATLERGKGKRKHVIEVTRHGTVLRRMEVESGDQRLPGYRRCASEAAAMASLNAEVLALLDEGMTAADDDARTIGGMRPAKPAGAPTLPLRADLAIYNEATGFVVTSRKMAGKTMDEGSAEWKKAVNKGQLLPMELVQDDPFNIRIVAGGPLDAAEEHAWTSRINWHLAVPDGKLCVTGGAEFSNEGYDADDPSHETYVGELEIPKGSYRATVYCCAHGVDGAARPEQTDEEIVDFVLHLEPVEALPKTGLSTLPDNGWFSYEQDTRAPGGQRPLPAVNLIRRNTEPTGRWTYVRNVFEMMPPVDRRPVTGDPLTLPLQALGHVARLAWLISRFTAIEFRLTPPSGGSLDLSGEWPEGVVTVVESGVGRVLFDVDLDLDTTRAALQSMAPRLAELPEGTVLDVCSVAVEPCRARSRTWACSRFAASSRTGPGGWRTRIPQWTPQR